MSDERSSHARDDEHHRRHTKPHHSRERHDREIDGSSHPPNFPVMAKHS